MRSAFLLCGPHLPVCASKHRRLATVAQEKMLTALCLPSLKPLPPYLECPSCFGVDSRLPPKQRAAIPCLCETQMGHRVHTGCARWGHGLADRDAGRKIRDQKATLAEKGDGFQVEIGAIRICLANAHDRRLPLS